MKKILSVAAVGAAILVLGLVLARERAEKAPTLTDGSPYCLTGAFLADKPTRADINDFKRDYGKKPYFVMIFIDWNKYPDLGVIKDILDEGCCPVITWEPWNAVEKTGIDIERLLTGGYDRYIEEMAKLLKSFRKEILLRFAHEMNGNWYPWSGSSVGPEKYAQMYRYVKDVFDRYGAQNVKWVFSVNWEDVPPIRANAFLNYYPGDEYVDYVGIDGYNWGDTQSWSRWMTFSDLFSGPYDKITAVLGKPVLITEFSSAPTGGDKARWIREGMLDIKKKPNIKGFIVFNVSKEAPWSFPIWSDAGREFKKQLEDGYFSDVRK
jgi:mannan endo-1,4-beta-mannosidase